MTERFDKRVGDVLDAFGVSGERQAAVVAWVGTVASWNERIDLTAARDDDELVDLMVADAAQLARVLEGKTVVDVGSGAGAPGLPLALLREDLSLTLVEPLQKRATVLRLSKGRHPWAQIDVVQGKGADVTQRFDVAISRATLPPPQWLELGAQLAPTVWVLLAKHEPPTRDGWAVVYDERYTWPLTGAERRIVCYQEVVQM